MKKIIFILLVFLIGCKNKEVLTYKPIESVGDSLIYYVNQERLSNGLSLLISEKKLNEIAEKKVKEMITLNSVSHNGFTDRVTQSKSVFMAENVGFGYNSELKLFNAYMKSDSHKKNILNSKVKYIGSYSQEKYNCTIFAYY